MKDPTKTIKYYDPIYEIITIKPYEKDWGGGRKFWSSAMGAQNEQLIENIIAKMLKSAEMSRLNFLRQSGLAFLVFPSSTHTRFAHSLGTYHLGLEALNRSWVKTSGAQIKYESLGNWVESHGLKEEFLLGLLLHDVGHFPFSHVLENNHLLPFKLESHEEIAVDYIIGGKYSEAFQEYLRTEYGLRERKRLSCIIDELNSELKGPIDKEVISFLICKDHNYITNRKFDLKEIEMLAEFTSGLLDLDRFDHYRRDSFFMGTNLARFNVSSFLDDVILTKDGIELKGDGVSHALSLLQSQDNIRTYNFENEENLVLSQVSAVASFI
ncbi:MAG: HD domain-containing protein [Candidatus Aminicenantes bacterium]|nr:HD domain-containing protein [Candidatus Aminicenantes bacterium]